MLNDKPKIELPALPRVPSFTADPLVIKLSATGVTLLKAERYKQRFTGGEAAVDINGKLHLSRKDLKNYLKKEDEEREQHKISLGYPQKKPRKISHDKPGTIELLNGSEDTEKKDLPVKKTGYTVNKTEVTNRIACMTTALFAAQKQSAFLGMLTVTFPPAVNEDVAMQALNTWLTALRQKGKRQLSSYIWVAERQDGKRLENQSKATNTIHFHLLILKRVNIVAVNRAMRVVLCNLVRQGVINYPLAAMKRYNGVDLAKDRKTRVVTNFMDPKSRKALSYYLTKYVTKNSEAFKHAAWGCSRGFSGVFTGITCTYNEFIRMGWSDMAWQEPVISTLWFDFFPWHKDTGPPIEFVNYLAKINLYVLQQKGLLN